MAGGMDKWKAKKIMENFGPDAPRPNLEEEDAKYERWGGPRFFDDDGTPRVGNGKGLLVDSKEYKDQKEALERMGERFKREAEERGEVTELQGPDWSIKDPIIDPVDEIFEVQECEIGPIQRNFSRLARDGLVQVTDIPKLLRACGEKVTEMEMMNILHKSGVFDKFYEGPAAIPVEDFHKILARRRELTACYQLINPEAFELCMQSLVYNMKMSKDDPDFIRKRVERDHIEARQRLDAWKKKKEEEARRAKAKEDSDDE